MGKKKKPGARADRSQTEPSGGLGALGAALSAKGFEPSSTVQTTPSADESRSAESSRARDDPRANEGGSVDELRGVTATLRFERKGRGGKSVTVVTGLDESRRAPLSHAWGKALGTRARIEGGDVVVGGDLRERLREWLEARGAKVRG